MDLLLRDIKAAEGCKLTAYKDTRKFWTIGYGHLLPIGRDWAGYTCTQEMADVWLEQDIGGATQAAHNLPEWLCMDTVCRQNALSELVFNMGSLKWRGFKKCRAAMQAHDWPTAARELLDSDWSEEVGVTRSYRLKGYLETGVYGRAP